MARKPSPRRIFVCSCEKTMPNHGDTVAAASGASVAKADQLCRAQIALFRDALTGNAPITVGCTQEQPLFEEIAEDAGFSGEIAFANVRETAGWSRDARKAGPKTAALLAAAAIDMPPITTVAMESQGVALILGRDEAAIEAGRRLADHLDITVLVERGAEVLAPRQTVFPVLQGSVRNAVGHLGQFELTIDAYALPDPSSRERLRFGPARDGATSTCDLVIDLTGGRPLFPASDLRAGYLRADPRDPAAVAQMIFEAAQLVGTFDKPRYVDYDPAICAHSRSTITGCTRCLDLCPTGAITPDGDHVSIDAAICAGCGQCAGACPTGAAAYALPPADALTARVRVLLRTYAEAGGTQPVLLLHDNDHGAALIDAAARFGDGLPADVLPLAVNEITQVGPELLAAALAYGARSVRLLSRARPRHDLSGLQATLSMMDRVFNGLGYGAGCAELIEADDPDHLAEALVETGKPVASRNVSGFLPTAGKRGLMELAFRELHRVAPTPVARIALDRGAPFGGLAVDTDACTLCLACVSACPADALSDNPERPTLRFTESLCVQCGLCEATCPEDAIALVPQLDFDAWASPKKTIKEEEPHHCIECGAAFGTRASIDRVMAKLSDHWMFSGPEGEHRRRVLQMCEDCRVSVVVKESFDPHEADTRRVRTTDDYLREREARKH
ncbi:4Fe-4S binding protein [Pararhizobium haloflavum]|uniref:4Fe-4S binding protein n=1 Tax=Pararhizobium haloflavum TaxID=2037914 RepID=UPI000C1996E5